jgi:hypothetical protein
MKKIYVLLFAVSSLIAVSQSAFQIKDQGNNNVVVVNNQVISMTTSANAVAVERDLEIKNVSAATRTFVMFKTENQLNTVVNPSDMASAYFCFNTFCYIPTTMSATIALTPGQTFTFHPKLDEASVVGQSNISYEFSDQSNGSDALNMEFRYNYPVGVKENSMKIAAVSALYPNPASTKATIDLSTERDMENVSIRVYNSLGVVVSDKKMDLAKGKTNVAIDAAALESGLYFVSIGNGNNRIVKKLIITK